MYRYISSWVRGFSSRQKLIGVTISVVILSLIMATSASAMLVSRRLSGPLPAFGDVFPGADCPMVSGWDWISPDSSRQVYIADQEEDAVCELYSVIIPYGPVVKLNDVLTWGGDVTDYFISPNSSRVVYRADQDTNGVMELYSTAINGGGTPVKLNGALVFGGNVNRYLISPDSSRVVYRADQDTYDMLELYSVPLLGGTPVKLNDPMYVTDFKISPDSTRVVYRVAGGNLYSVAITGGTPVLLSAGTPSGQVGGFQISQDNSRVVFDASPGPGFYKRLYSIAIGGGTLHEINGTMVSNGQVIAFKISPNSATVVFLADKDTYSVEEIYSVPIDGGSTQKLNGALVSGGSVRYDIIISPDSSRVVYVADQETQYKQELYSVPIGGGTPVKLNGALVSGGDVYDGYFTIISLDSSRVIYLADQETDEVGELFSVPIAGGTPVKLNGPLQGTDGLRNTPAYNSTPDSTQVVFLADYQVDNVMEFYSVPIGGGAQTRLNGNLVTGGSVNGFGVSPNGQWIVYKADQDVDEKFELFVSYVEPYDSFLPVIQR